MHRANSVLVILVVTAAIGAAAGPVGQYLGFRVGKCARAVSTEHDSVHYFWPIEEDTVWDRAGIDTTTIVREFNLGSNPAYARFYRYYGSDTNYADVDTNWEESGTDLKARDEFFDTFTVTTPYRIPFSIGASWLLGMTGTYYVDIDGDGNKDTFKIWRDTVRVIGQEDVTVPYGLIRNAYKLSSRFYARLSMTTQGIPIRDTLSVNVTEWYKDSLWAVKDSLYQSEKIYVNLGGMWIHYASGFRWQLSLLSHLWVGIADQIAALRTKPAFTPNPFHRQLVINAPDIESAGQLLVWDAAGRLVDERPFRKDMIWRPTGLPAGVYYLRVRTVKNEMISLGRAVYLE